MRKKVLSMPVGRCSDRNNFILFSKKLSRDFFKFTFDPAVKRVKYLNLTMSIEQIIFF